MSKVGPNTFCLSLCSYLVDFTSPGEFLPHSVNFTLSKCLNHSNCYKSKFLGPPKNLTPELPLKIDLYGVTFWMPELASYSFQLFYQFFGKRDKSSVLRWEFRFVKIYDGKRIFIGFQGNVDWMNWSHEY